MNLRRTVACAVAFAGILHLIGCTPPPRPAPAPTPAQSTGAPSGFVSIPAGTFEMGDHHNLGGREHRNDELPLHAVSLPAFYMAAMETTNQEYCAFLNAKFDAKEIVVQNGQVFAADGKTLFCDTAESDSASSIRLNGTRFEIVDHRAEHPVVCIRWNGAAAYCNWRSELEGLAQCYDPATWRCDYGRTGYRLPSEAEWEYAALGGANEQYPIFPWGDEPDNARANWPDSGDPYETGPIPWTTPVGFYNGEPHAKAQFGWPGDQAEYKTANGANGYGLFDMSGNVWEWVNDWYAPDYYAQSPALSPTGPETGQPMPDGNPYRVLRGGNWYNGEWGHGRLSNRDPSYFRGPDDPNHRWYHIGFRVARSAEDQAALPPRKESEPTPQPRGERPPRERAPRVPGKFQGTDSNGDGAVTVDEYVFHERKKFGRIDTDGSGTLTEAEIDADERQQRGGAATGGRNRFERTDANRDGTVSLDEYIAAERAKFDERDTDRNGVLSQPELEAAQPRPNDRNAPPPLTPPRRDEAPRSPARQGPREAPALNFSALSEDKLGIVTNGTDAAPGYTLFAPKHRTMTYLIDNAGRVIHEWNACQYEPGQTVYLRENGNLLRCCFTHARGFTRGGEGGRLEEYDWDDNLVWEFDYASDQHMLHHDVAILPNGNILALAVERRTREQCVAAGFDPDVLIDGELYPDYIIEIAPTRPKGGAIVWEWHVWDHLIQDRDTRASNFGVIADHPERIDVNCNGRRAPAFWNHMNSIAYNSKLDQILLSVRGCNEIWIVDHSTTTQEAASHSGGKYGKGGDLLYRWGNPAAYRRGGDADRQLFDQHDAHWIADGCPGAGNILIFNNGLDRGYSSIEEIVPPLNSNGDYTTPTAGAFGPVAPVWNYSAPNKADFYSSEISGADRLPNGNTLICAGVLGTFFEVTPKGETVWKYVNPVVRGGTLAQGETPGVDDRGHFLNAVFKVRRYPPHYAGLAGRPLAPGSPIELPADMKGKTGLDRVNTMPVKGPDHPRGPSTDSTESGGILRAIGYL
ncbi:MAG: SUMF1/EgtB/PvdO family nonheme iron enzyme [Candidatus Hydrogenedentes bacterium]|nr:SUMF1/EgtB/PvdO family nonheme iron enzyme [Candidatus Hydrogenedentota bacterium]